MEPTQTATAATPATVPMTPDQVKGLITESIAAAIPGAVKEAIEPLTKAVDAQTSAAIRTASADIFDEKQLGAYPYGRKALAVALAALEGVPADDLDGVVKVAKKHWRVSPAESVEKWAKHIKEMRTKATLTVGAAATAGDMVFPDYDPAWIELLRNNAVIRGLCRTIPMPRGATSRRRQTGAGTASYQGELGPITPSNQTVGRVNLSYKKLTAATVVSNDLIRFAGPEADRLVQEDLLRVSALREDRAFLVGNPPTDAGSPQGIRYQTATGQVAASAGTTLANFQSDLTDLIADVQDANIPAEPGTACFIMSPRTFWTIYALATTTGDLIFAADLQGATPRIYGFPVKLTTQLSVGNSWIGANGGMIFFVYTPALEIHDSMARTVEAFRGGAYRDTSGTVQSGISNDETVITCISEHDFFQAYDVAAAIKTGLAT